MEEKKTHESEPSEDFFENKNEKLNLKIEKGINLIEMRLNKEGITSKSLGEMNDNDESDGKEEEENDEEEEDQEIFIKNMSKRQLNN